MTSGEVVSNHSYGNLLHNAWRACERSHQNSGEALTAILLCAISVESFLNGIAELTLNPTQQDYCTDEEKELGAFLSELEAQRASPAIKISLIYFFFNRKTLDKGRQPMQDYALLVDIRNAIAHQKPERVDFAQRQSDGTTKQSPLLRRLIARGLAKKPNANAHLFWYSAIQEPHVAEWAFNCSCQTIDFIVSIFPDGDFKRFLSSLRDLRDFAAISV